MQVPHQEGEHNLGRTAWERAVTPLSALKGDSCSDRQHGLVEKSRPVNGQKGGVGGEGSTERDTQSQT